MTGLRALSIEQAVRPAPSWTERAACQYSDPELFFDTGQDLITMTKGTISKENLKKREMAKAVCRRCPVIDLCREHYLDEPHGVYGGLDRDERKALRIARDAIARSTDSPDDIGREAYALFLAGEPLTALAKRYKLRTAQLRAYLDAYLSTPDGMRAQLEYHVREDYEAGLSEAQSALRLNINVAKVGYVRRKLGLLAKQVSQAPVKVSENRWDSSVTIMGSVLNANYMGESADDPPFYFMHIKYPHAATRKWVPADQVNLGAAVRRHVISKGVGSGKKRDGNTKRSA